MHHLGYSRDTALASVLLQTMLQAFLAWSSIVRKAFGTNIALGLAYLLLSEFPFLLDIRSVFRHVATVIISYLSQFSSPISESVHACKVYDKGGRTAEARLPRSKPYSGESRKEMYIRNTRATLLINIGRCPGESFDRSLSQAKPSYLRRHRSVKVFRERDETLGLRSREYHEDPRCLGLGYIVL